MGSKKKPFQSEVEPDGDVRDMLAGMAQLLEWMNQLLNAAIKRVDSGSCADEGVRHD